MGCGSLWAMSGSQTDTTGAAGGPRNVSEEILAIERKFVMDKGGAKRYSNTRECGYAPSMPC